MHASEKTKYRLATAMKELMETKPVDKITVTEIVSACDMTRQTFYRNFLDKYDLVNWYFDKLAQKSFRQMGVSLTLQEGLQKKFEFIRSERHFFAAAFSSQDQNSLIQYDFECIYQFYTEVIKRKEKHTLDSDEKFLLEMYCRGSIDMTVKWATTGMKEEPEKLAHLMARSLPPELEKLLVTLQP